MLKLRITIRSDAFEAEGDFPFDDAFLATFRTWVNAIADVPNPDAIAERLNRQSDSLAHTVAAHAHSETKGKGG